MPALRSAGLGAGLVAAAVAGPLAAEPAPDYFVAGAFETSTAQAIARSCTTLSIDPVASTALTDELLARLAADGLTPDTILERMDDPSAEIAVLQAGFLARHGLADGAPEGEVCAAGRREIAEGTPIGALLTPVAP
jgi:hypothetical protein